MTGHRLLDTIAAVLCIFAGSKASMILWPIDPILSFMTAGAFLVLFCDFLLAAIDGDPA